MVETLIIICILAGLTAIPNYIAYVHVQHYKYYKQVRTISIQRSLIGIILGLPFIIFPFAFTENDQSFMKYPKVKISLYWARATSVLFILISAYLMYNQIFNR